MGLPADGCGILYGRSVRDSGCSSCIGVGEVARQGKGGCECARVVLTEGCRDWIDAWF